MWSADPRLISGSQIRIIWITDPFVKVPLCGPTPKKIISHLLAVARDVVTERGADASMRDIARRAGVGLATLLRHFPTREALFEPLLRTKLDALTQKAGELETSSPADDALLSWFREGVAFVDSYSGVVAFMASAHENPDSALYAPCSAGARLLLRAQAEGTARADMDADDLFALMSALGWLVGQHSFAPRVDHLFHLITSAILTNLPNSDVKKANTRRGRGRPARSRSRAASRG